MQMLLAWLLKISLSVLFSSPISHFFSVLLATTASCWITVTHTLLLLLTSKYPSPVQLITMAGTTTLLPGRGWIANALACALILALAPPILLSVVLALTPALAFLFVFLLTFALPLFLIVAAVRSAGRQIAQVFVAVVPCVGAASKTGQKAAVSLPVTLPTSGGKLVSG